MAKPKIPFASTEPGSICSFAMTTIPRLAAMLTLLPAPAVPRHPLTVSALSAILLCGILPCGIVAAAAAAGPVGQEYGINDRTPAPPRWWTSCTDAGGRSATLLGSKCSGPQCEESGDLFLQRYDSTGHAMGGSVRVNDGKASLVGFRVACSDEGWVMAQWVESGCYRQRAIDPQNHLAGVAMQAAPLDCRTRANVAIDDVGMMVAAWPNALPGEGTQIFVRRFEADGEPVADGIQISEGPAGWRLQPKVSIDESGVALIAWLGQATLNSDHGPVIGRFVDAGGKPKGAAFEINTFGFGLNSDPAIRRLGAGAFEVSWTNLLEGGRVAREVRANGAPVSSVVASADSEAPHFGAVRIVDSYPHGTGLETATDAGAGTTWMISDSSLRHWRSDDDARSWSGPIAASAGASDREVLGTDGAGVWVALKTSDVDVRFSRSTDNGATWSDLEAVLHGPDGRIEGARVRSAGATWIAAWSISGVGDTDQGVVAFARSSDGGKTWGTPTIVSTGADSGRLGFALDTDGDGTWIAMLADAGVRFVRSSDDGRNWSVPPAVVASAYCDPCAGIWRYTRVDLAHGAADDWLAVFAAPRYQTGLFGRDGDVFVLRSSNGGVSWAPPLPIAAYATGDGSPDFSPSIATDGDGTWLASWISHHPAGANDNLDSDVLVAVSNDDGASWSAPTLLDTAMDTDQASDIHLSLAAGSGGRWMASWERQSFAAVNGFASDDLVVAVAEATCGNGRTEIGESCDDVNLADNDGCDSNCTAGECGNGIVNAGEDCDDGNHDDADWCSTACRTPNCGDGVVSPVESCDDGNSINTDSCPDNCGAPGCGDGIVQTGFEECDGGFALGLCTSNCRLPRCGDGEIARYVEACDDGNTIDDDACPDDCSTATCGDGITSIGWEECDPADPLYASGCTADCLLVGLCGDANADDEVTTADARRVLKRAVGLSVDCPRAACDMNASGAINVTDAQMDLRKAVGLAVGDKCSIGTGTIVFWIDDTRELGAFQIDVDYSSTGGEFSGSGSDVACHTLIEDGDRLLFAFNDVEFYGVLTAGFIALDSFGGRVDLFSCEFAMPEERVGTHFAVHVTDATDASGEKLDPAPLVGYRVE